MAHPSDVKPISPELFRASRLSTLVYGKFEGDAPAQKQAQAEIRQAGLLMGFDSIDFFWDRNTDTQGLIAYTKDGKAFVTFRGTESEKDRETDLKHDPISEPKYYGNADVHRGFHEAVDSVYGQIQGSLLRHQAKTVYTTGHSMGGGEAQLAAPRLANDSVLANQHIKVAGVYTFEAPHVSNGPALTREYQKHGITDVVRVEQNNDIVTRVNSDPSRGAFKGLMSNLDGRAPSFGTMGERALWAWESQEKFFNPYFSGIGGCAPDGNREETVGDFLYLDADHRVRRNPSVDEVAVNRFVVFAHKPLGVIEQHFHYDQHLFSNMSRQDRNTWRRTLEEQRTQVERQFYDPHTQPEQKNRLTARWNAIRGEQEALDGNKWMTNSIAHRDVVNRRHALEVQRAEVEKKLCAADPGSDPAQHRSLEQHWNAIRGEQEAIDGRVWVYHHDRRGDFRYEKWGSSIPNRAGVVSEEVKVRGTIHQLRETPINWCEDVRHGNEQALRTMDAQLSQGKGFIIAPEFGADPGELLNYDSQVNTYCWGNLEGELKHEARLEDQRELAPLDVRVNLRSSTDQQGKQLRYPPEVTALDKEQRPLTCSLEERWTDKGQERKQTDAVVLDERPIGAHELAAEQKAQSKPAQERAAETKTASDQQPGEEAEEEETQGQRNSRSRVKKR